ncbi:MAG: hypothetical protein ABSF28_04310 [Terracidiphilus sp.]|jgi:hypothetical protein
MSACPAQSFANVAPNQFALLQQKAQASGIPLEGNSGAASSFGGKFEWNYDPATQALTITVASPPFLMNCESVNARIGALVRGVLA